MSILQSFHLQGQTTGGTAIATVAADIHSDGFIRYTDSLGHARQLSISGELAHLLKEMLTGTSRLTTAFLE